MVPVDAVISRSSSPNHNILLNLSFALIITGIRSPRITLFSEIISKDFTAHGSVLICLVL